VPDGVPGPVARAGDMADEDLAWTKPVAMGTVRRRVGDPGTGGGAHQIADDRHDSSLELRAVLEVDREQLGVEGPERERVIGPSHGPSLENHYSSRPGDSARAHDSNAAMRPRMLRNCGRSSDFAIHPTLGAAGRESLTAGRRFVEQSRKPSQRTDFQQAELSPKSGREARRPRVRRSLSRHAHVGLAYSSRHH
jgi:hypothetical protein